MASLFVAFGLVAALTLQSCRQGLADRDGTEWAEADPGAIILDQVAGLAPHMPYRDPDRKERGLARAAARTLVEAPGDHDRQAEAFRALGFVAHHGDDPAAGRPYGLFLDRSTDRAWGAVLVNRSVPPRVVVEVPHPQSDINTERLGLALHRRLPGSVLLVAGAHRAAGDGDADVAHNDRSAFHAFAAELARLGLPQIQVHGFADRNLPDADAVVSTGSAAATDLAREVADGLRAIDLEPCRAWRQRCGRLEGTRNEQGRVAAELGAVFLHLELNWTVRQAADRREEVARVVAQRYEVWAS